MARLDVKIIPAKGDAVLLANSDFGEAVVRIDGSFLNEMKQESQNLRKRYSLLLYREEDPEVLKEVVATLGERLFRGVFCNDLLDLFNRTAGGSDSGQLDIRLMLGTEDLNTIQWEIMRFREEYIGFRHNLVRHPFVSRPVKIPDETREKLHVLVVGVDPFNGKRTIETEHNNLLGILGGFGDQIRVTSLKQDEATVERIMDVLFEGVDIWHFTGHGLFDPANPIDSALVVWGGTPNDPAKISVRSLRTLAMSQSLGFSFLNACNTARSADSEEGKETRSAATAEYFVNMAHSLILAGVPMVVATNHEITVEAATRLSRRFYTSVVKHHKRVDQAVREARAELYLGGKRLSDSDWSCPVLYARSKQLGLGTEGLRWEAAFDLYSVRNIESPTYPDVEIVREAGTTL
jgi:hypothetical protein